MLQDLSRRMFEQAQVNQVEPPGDFEGVVRLFGKGIGDPKLLNDLNSGLYRDAMKEFSKDHILEILGKIIEINEMLQLVVERTILAHRYVEDLNHASGDQSPRRMVALQGLEQENMTNSILAAVKAYRNNLAALHW